MDWPLLDVERLGYFGIDVGGTLCKICFYEPKKDERVRRLIDFLAKDETYGTTGKRDQSLSIRHDQGRFHFILFETRRMVPAMERIVQAGLFPLHPTSPTFASPTLMDAPIRQLSMTGGGAHRFLPLFQHFQLDVRLHVHDEMQSLVEGMNFALTHFEKECFYHPHSPESVRHPSVPERRRSPSPRVEKSGSSLEEDSASTITAAEKVYLDVRRDLKDPLFPYLIVNIGTGVSFLKVEADGSFERISGSGLGGGTYWGLVRLLTRCQTFNESLSLCAQGSSTHVDMTVGDIYGGDYNALHLDKDMTACFFGKFVNRDVAELRKSVTDADLCNGLMLMVTNNLGQVSYLLAKLHSIHHVFFTGSFLRHSAQVDVATCALSNAIAFWSGQRMRALFLRHEGYLGSLGAYLAGFHPPTNEEPKGGC